jgi:hypothetical protein
MGAWGIGLYASDFALDLRATVGAVARLPLDEDKLVAAICAAEETAAENPADEDHTVFWLVLADQFEKRSIFSARVREKALAIIDGGKDAEMMGKLGLQPADLRKRAAKLAELRARILAQPTVSKPRKTMTGPAPYVFEVGGVYAYPIRGGEPINPYLSAKQFNRSEWQAQGFGLMLVITRARAFDYLPWYNAATALEAVASIPDRTKLLGEIRWGQPIYGTCNPPHFRNMELTELGVFPLDRARIDHFFPHLAPGTVYAVQDISIANKMEIPGDQRPRRWRRPDGKLEQIVYPPRPTIAELVGGAA